MGKGGFLVARWKRTCLPVQGDAGLGKEQLSLRVTTLGPRALGAWEPQLLSHTPGACAHKQRSLSNKRRTHHTWELLLPKTREQATATKTQHRHR